MKLLLDTQVVLWWLSDDRRLGRISRKLISDANSVLFVSAVSLWECRIRERLGKLTVPGNLDKILAEQGFLELPASWQQTEMIKALGKVAHPDPFDLLLIAQAKTEMLGFMTADQAILKFAKRLVTTHDAAK